MTLSARAIFGLMRKAWPVFVVLAVVLAATHIKGRIDSAELKAANAELRATASERREVAWKDAVETQNEAVASLQQTLVTLEGRMVERDALFERRWDEARLEARRNMDRAAALAETPTVGVDDEVEEARGLLKDTEGFGYLPTLQQEETNP